MSDLNLCSKKRVKLNNSWPKPPVPARVPLSPSFSLPLNEKPGNPTLNTVRLSLFFNAKAFLSE